MIRLIRIRVLTLAIIATLLGGCGSLQSERKIRGVLDSQVDAWNTGDIEGFMQGYWKSDDLVFVSPKGETRGWQATLDRYRQRYPTREKMGQLRFSDLKIRSWAAKGPPNKPDSAEVTGRYEVQTVEGKAMGGFTLDMRRIDGQWVIVKDITTTDQDK